MAETNGMMLDATIESLRRHAPFDRMARDALAFLVGKFKLAYFAKGRKITGPDHGTARALYIIQRGLVRAERVAHALPGEGTMEYYTGECFPLAAVYGKRRSNNNYTALEDTFCYEVGADDVDELVRLSPPFREFCDRRTSALLQQSYTRLQSMYAQQSAGERSMTVPLRDLVRRAPVSCKPSGKLLDALQLMQRAKVGSIVVVDEERAPRGIFTERDLLRHSVNGGVDLDRAIQAYMTPSPHCLAAGAGAWEAAVLMARMSIRHVVVVEEGRLLGVVSERDLFALQRMSVRNIIHPIEMATSAQDLTQIAADIRQLECNMMAHGAGAEQLTQLIVTLNDKLSRRIIELEAQRHGLDGSDFCWIALGSEGRLEQTLSTDQDNGIVFASDQPAEAMRLRLLPFARSVNELLDVCGFPLCKGNIMASNPEWCLSLGEWEEKFGNWIRTPVPEALLNSTIFYDFRPLWGREDLAHRLRSWLLAHVKDDLRFLRAMAENALLSRPPPGLLTSFLVAATGGEASGIDLKGQGTRPFVDAARIYALASGIEHTNTAERLRLAGERLNIPPEEIEAMVEAFHFLLLFRLRRQYSGEHLGAAANRIKPNMLNELDRRILREAFRQARKLQSRLTLDYNL